MLLPPVPARLSAAGGVLAALMLDRRSIAMLGSSSPRERSLAAPGSLGRLGRVSAGKPSRHPWRPAAARRGPPPRCSTHLKAWRSARSAAARSAG